MLLFIFEVKLRKNLRFGNIFAMFVATPTLTLQDYEEDDLCSTDALHRNDVYYPF